MQRCNLFFKEKEKPVILEKPELYFSGSAVLDEMSKLKKKYEILKRIYFQNLYNPLIKFIEQRGSIIENIEQILFLDNENYLEIIFLVYEPNINITYKISRLTYDIRTEFPDIELDFMVLDEKDIDDKEFNKFYSYYI